MGNDPVQTRLFISTLKGVAFEWFRKLPKGSITCWDDLEALFLSRFFEEVADINMHTLLLTKQKEGELVKDFIERFCELAMRSRSGMTPETLVETCRHNFLTPILVQMGLSNARPGSSSRSMSRLHKNWWPSSKTRRRTTERLEGVDHLQGAIKILPSKRKPWQPICSKLQPLVPLGWIYRPVPGQVFIQGRQGRSP